MKKGSRLVLLMLLGSFGFLNIMAVEPSGPVKASVFVTAKGTAFRLTPVEKALSFQPYTQTSEGQPFVFVDPHVAFQTMIGIGGALTDATAETFKKLPDAAKEEWLTAYYDSVKGIGYDFARTSIGSCDFSSHSYTYVDEQDASLKTFSVAHDETARIPLLRKAIAAAGGKLPLLISPWSPPGWMKDNHDQLHGGSLLDQYKQTWADYVIKFINAYEKEGIPVWGLTVQNEPMATQKWESCVYTAEQERDFIKRYLGPALEKNQLSDKKIIAWDHNRDLLYQRASLILSDPDAARYVWGIGFHWYEPWSGGNMQFDNVSLVNQAFPDKKLIFTEGCVEKYDRARLTDWALGERYGYSMLNDFNRGTVAWSDWNMLLDENGGPNHVGNYCFAPVHADLKAGKLMYTNSYYYIGHFSKFVRPGARRIACSSNRDLLETTAFINPDGKIAVIVLNRSETKIDYKLELFSQAASFTSLPHSMMTVVLTDD